MESSTSLASLDNAEAKPAFRKPSNDAGTRHYRRRSPVGESPSPEKYGRSSSPIPIREDSRRDTFSTRNTDEEMDLDRGSGEDHHGQSGNKHRQSDRQSLRRNYDNYRGDNYTRRDKFMDESSSCSRRESRYDTHYEHERNENERYKSRHHSRGDEKYSRDRTDGSGDWSRGKHRDERRDYRRGDRKDDSSPVFDSGLKRDKAGNMSKEMAKSDPKEFDDEKYAKEEKRKVDNKGTCKQMNGSDRQPREQFKERSVFTVKNEDSPAKKLKPSSLGNYYEKCGDDGKS